MHAHLLRCRAICYDLTVYVLSYIYFPENIHPQALGSICYVMNLSSSSVIERQKLFQNSFLEILNQKDPSKNQTKMWGRRELRAQTQAVMGREINVTNSWRVLLLKKTTDFLAFHRRNSTFKHELMTPKNNAISICLCFQFTPHHYKDPQIHFNRQPVYLTSQSLGTPVMEDIWGED